MVCGSQWLSNVSANKISVKESQSFVKVIESNKCQICFQIQKVNNRSK